MAGLTKEQRAARAAEQAQEPASGLIRMAKDGETLDVHPSCVKDHERVGWVRVAE